MDCTHLQEKWSSGRAWVSSHNWKHCYPCQWNWSMSGASFFVTRTNTSCDLLFEVIAIWDSVKQQTYLFTILETPLALLIGFCTCCNVYITWREEYPTGEILLCWLPQVLLNPRAVWWRMTELPVNSKKRGTAFWRGRKPLQVFTHSREKDLVKNCLFSFSSFNLHTVTPKQFPPP